MTRLAALTGATGFLGAHLVQALAAEGFRVRVLARRAPSPPGWGEARPEVVAGTLSDRDALLRLVEGADAVIHAAGAIKPGAEGFLQVNRDGARAVAEAALGRAPGARFVLVSSLAARAPELSPYAASKREGERAAVDVLDPARVAVVRPPAIYGPGDRSTLPVFKAAAWPVLPVPSRGARFALIHVADAARAIAALAGSDAAGTFALADQRPEGYGWAEVLAAAGHAVGGKPRLVSAPSWLLPAAERLFAALESVAGQGSVVSAGKLREMMHPDWAVRPDELWPLAPRPQFGLEDGFADTVAWCRAAGWIR